MLHSINSFIRYFSSIRRRTKMYLQTVPTNQIDWAPQAGEFTYREIVSHLTAAEKMFVGVVVDGKWFYQGHTHDTEKSWEELLVELDTVHAEAMIHLSSLSNEQLYTRRPTLNGPSTKAWRLLMAMVEHEIHHRSQLATHLALMGVEPPQIYGMGVEDVIAMATG